MLDKWIKEHTPDEIRLTPALGEGIPLKHLNPGDDPVQAYNRMVDLLNSWMGQGKLVRVVTLGNAYRYRQGDIDDRTLEEVSWLTNLP